MKQDKPISRVDKGWASMQQTLDNRMPVNGRWYRFLIFLLPVAFLGALLFGCYMYQEHSIDHGFRPGNAPVAESAPMISTQALESKSAPISGNTEKQQQSSPEVMQGVNEENQPANASVIDDNTSSTSGSGDRDASEGTERPSLRSVELSIRRFPDATPQSQNDNRAGSYTLNEVISNPSASDDLLTIGKSRTDAESIQNRLVHPFSTLPSVFTPLIRTTYYVTAAPRLAEGLDLVTPQSRVKPHFIAAIGITADRAYQLDMWGAAARIRTGMSTGHLELTIFGGYGLLEKSSLSTDLQMADSPEPTTGSPSAEDEESLITNLGIVNKNGIERLQYYDLGIGVAFRFNNRLMAGTSLGQRHYHRVRFSDSVIRANDPLFQSPNALEYGLDRGKVIFSEWNIRYTVIEGLQVMGMYHYEFQPIIDKNDVFHGHSVSAGLQYVF